MQLGEQGEPVFACPEFAIAAGGVQGDVVAGRQIFQAACGFGGDGDAEIGRALGSVAEGLGEQLAVAFYGGLVFGNGVAVLVEQGGEGFACAVFV